MKKRDEILRTQLEDLQSEMESGARRINTIADGATEMRSRLLARHLEQADLAGKLSRQVSELQKSIKQQLETLADLRRAIRGKSSQAQGHRTTRQRDAIPTSRE